jgi:hypothetical protein
MPQQALLTNQRWGLTAPRQAQLTQSDYLYSFEAMAILRNPETVIRSLSRRFCHKTTRKCPSKFRHAGILRNSSQTDPQDRQTHRVVLFPAGGNAASALVALLTGPPDLHPEFVGDLSAELAARQCSPPRGHSDRAFDFQRNQHECRKPREVSTPQRDAEKGETLPNSDSRAGKDCRVQALRGACNTANRRVHLNTCAEDEVPISALPQH